MPSCDTCALLKVPDNAEHARHYRICGWQPGALPEPVLQLENLQLRRMSAARWVTLKVLTDDPGKLPPCSCWQSRNEADGELRPDEHPRLSSPSRKFYKYMKADTAKTVLENNSLRWSSPTLFNDPFDLQFDLHLEFNSDRVVSRVLDRFVDVYTGRAQPTAGSTLDENANLLRIEKPGLKEEAVRRETRPAIDATIRAIEAGLPKLHDELRAVLAPRKILCLSEMPDNLLMWAHYAEHHRGAVIEFSYIEEGKYASAWGAAKPVRYAAEIPKLADEAALVRRLLGHGHLATPEQFQDSVYVKAETWAYEKEWRVLGGWEDENSVEDIPFRPNEMTAVYLGCRMSNADQEQIRAMVGEKYPHAVIRAGTKSTRRFALVFAGAA